MIGIRIGRGRTSARWRLRDQGAIDDLLRFLERLRKARRTRVGR